MNQQIQPQEQIQSQAVQALWIQTTIGALMVIGMICLGLAEVIKAATGVVKK